MPERSKVMLLGSSRFVSTRTGSCLSFCMPLNDNSEDYFPVPPSLAVNSWMCGDSATASKPPLVRDDAAGAVSDAKAVGIVLTAEDIQRSTAARARRLVTLNAPAEGVAALQCNRLDALLGRAACLNVSRTRLRGFGQSSMKPVTCTFMSGPNGI